MDQPAAYSYIRMSTNLQLKGDSLRRQAELSRTYADKHGLRLVPETELSDIGVSAFRGANVSDGALGDFLDKVEGGDIPKGSYLLVESLDRISRQDIVSSTNLLLKIIGLGVNVVTLQDERRYSKDDADMASLVISIAQMSRAHDESLMKSRRVSAAWKAKRDRISEQKLTKICPAWLDLASDRKSFVVIEPRHAIVRRIFDETEQGMGSYLVTKRLNQEGIPPFGRSKLWVQSYVTKILQNRAVIGEYQPHTLVDRKRIPEGLPIPGYFPQVVGEGQFYRVQQLRKSRIGRDFGRRGEFQRNLFTNIAKCGYCKSPMRLINKGAGPKGGIYLKCVTALSGGDCIKTSWKYDDFERSFLFFAREIDLDAVLNASARIQAKREWLAEYEGLASKLQHEKLARDRVMDLLTDERQDLAFLRERLARSAEMIRQVQEQMNALQASPEDRATASQITAPELLTLIASVQNDAALEARVNLAAHLKKLVKGVYLEVEGNAPYRAKAHELVGPARDEFAQRVLDHMEGMDIALEASEPRFIVEFVDGRTRFVRVRRGDPTNVLEMLVGGTLEGNGPKDAETWFDSTEDGWFLNEIIRDRLSTRPTSDTSNESINK